MMSRSKRSSGFEAFAAQRAPVRFRNLMTGTNRAHLPAGFEQTIATREMPMFGAEIAESQSLRGERRAGPAGRSLPRPRPAKQPIGLAKFFHREREFAKPADGKGGKR
jgi:hypothetical protein